MLFLLAIALALVNGMPVETALRLRALSLSAHPCQDCKDFVQVSRTEASKDQSDEDFIHALSASVTSSCPSFFTTDQCTVLSTGLLKSLEDGNAGIFRSGVAVSDCSHLPLLAQFIPGLTVANPCDDDAPKTSFAKPGLHKPGKCFLASSTVELQNGSIIPLSSLNLGDVVRTGKTEYERVFFFTHRDLDEEMLTLTLSTQNTKISLSPTHYLYNGNQTLVEARHFVVGDWLFLNGENLEQVEDISFHYDVGAINVQTRSGKILVNGILASTYTANNYFSPTVTSLLLKPLDILFDISPNAVEWFQDVVFPILHKVEIHAILGFDVNSAE